MTFPTLAISLLACTGPGGDGSNLDPIEIDVSLSEVVTTVPTVSWQADDVTAAWVVVDGASDSWRVAVDLGSSGQHQTPVLGLKPDTTYTLSVEGETADGTRTSDPVEVTTGLAPNTLPNIHIDQIDPARMSGGYFATGLVQPSGAVIVDADGDPVWWYLSDDEIGVVRLMPSADGNSMLAASLNPHFKEEAPVLRISLDGTTVDSVQADDRHHDFTELPDGTLVWLADDERTVDDTVVRGDQLVERAPDGTIRTVYSVWDDHEFDGSQDFPGEANEVGWPHANYVQYLPDDDDYLVSFLHLKGIARIDRATGTQEWFLGGDDSTMFDSAGGTDFFAGQHGLDMLDDSILVFVNGEGDTDSHAVEVRVDPDAGQAEEIWSYWPEPSLGTPVLGDVKRLDNGNTLVTFSFSGAVHEVTPEGEPVWTLTTDLGGAVTFMTWQERLQAE